ncbi:GIY-YIG nuclease family protein [Marinoscillum sp.]|uniref:GIY-YIG nuclease family protein n=1 Tax=Marinoscillum sp. TaxID=2024838 RepID=UPI003BAB5F21
MHWCYIIFSKKRNRYYIGETSDVAKRISEHNTGYYKGAYTKSADDWTICLQLECLDRSHARKVETFIKRMKSRKFIEK